MSTIRTALPGLGLALGLVLGARPVDGSPSSEQTPTAGEIDRLEGDVRRAGLGPELLRASLAEARRALDRARGARAAGDEPHAALLDRLAGEWLALGSATLRAVRAENAAAAASARAADLRTKLERGRALLAEDQARQGRLQAEVRRLEQERAPSAGAKPTPKPTPPSAPKKGGAAGKKGKP